MLEQGVGGHTCGRPKPVRRERRIDLGYARQRTVTTVAIALAEASDVVRHYLATSGQRTWFGTVAAATTEAAIIEVILDVRAQSPDLGHVRFVPPLPTHSQIWRHCEEISGLFPDATVERSTIDDQDLMQTARAALDVVVPPVPEATTLGPETTQAPPGGAPIWVATDGSVRGKITGCGWLASSGDYAKWGFHHSTKQIGTSVVLISELRAIGDALKRLHHHRHITLLCDSRPALHMVTQWLAGHLDLPRGYTVDRPGGKEAGLVAVQRLVLECRDRLTATWTPGHRGEPLNEGADALARLASRYAAGRSGLTPAEYADRAAGLAEAFAAEFNRRVQYGA